MLPSFFTCVGRCLQQAWSCSFLLQCLVWSAFCCRKTSSEWLDGWVWQLSESSVETQAWLCHLWRHILHWCQLRARVFACLVISHIQSLKMLPKVKCTFSFTFCRMLHSYYTAELPCSSNCLVLLLIGCFVCMPCVGCDFSAAEGCWYRSRKLHVRFCCAIAVWCWHHLLCCWTVARHGLVYQPQAKHSVLRRAAGLCNTVWLCNAM